MGRFAQIFNPRWWLFEWRYGRGRTPWDTEITPPEVVEFMEGARPGRALDLGCGTGTNAIALARIGWEVTGVDFVPKAIRKARRKGARAGLKIDFRVGDVADLGDLEGPFDYALDIGCLFTLRAEQRRMYAAGLSRLLRKGGHYMLYGWLPRLGRGRPFGISPEEVDALFVPAFARTRTVIGEERGEGSAWYWLTKRYPLATAFGPEHHP